MDALRWSLALGALGLVTSFGRAAYANPYSVGLDYHVVGPLADFTHDGRADYAEQNAAGAFYVHRNLGMTFDSNNYDQGQTTCTSAIAATCDVMVGDFTGDGFADYADRDRATGNFYVHANRTYGFGFDSANWGTGQTGTGNVLVADFTGDGRADFADLDANGVLSIHENFGYLGTPGKFGGRNVTWYVKSTGSTNLLVGDFTGDGYADYAVLNAAYGLYEIHQNLGMPWTWIPGFGFGFVAQGFSDGVWARFAACHGTAGGDCKTLIGDFNGDKLADKADQDLVTGAFTVYLNQGPNLVSSSPPGAGMAVTAFESGKSCVPSVQFNGTAYPPQQWCGLFGEEATFVVNESY